MRYTVVAALAATLVACGAESTTADGSDTQRMAMSADTASTPSGSNAVSAATGTRIIVRGSEFGRMLFDSRRQAIYIFERDRRNRSNCYGECAKLWPPVYTKAKPRAGTGVKQSLLGTTRRRNGRLQVTYNGKPLYFYAHEEPGEVKCHNVNLNGGLWWVIGPNGQRRP